jgi:hypothetical protein
MFAVHIHNTLLESARLTSTTYTTLDEANAAARTMTRHKRSFMRYQAVPVKRDAAGPYVTQGEFGPVYIGGQFDQEPTP